MKAYNGTAWGIHGTIHGILTNGGIPFYKRKNHILVTRKIGFSDIGYAGFVLTGGKAPLLLPWNKGISLKSGTTFDFYPGDIVSLSQDGNINFAWESTIEHNALLTTEACNCRCVMCPQPPKSNDKMLLNYAYEIINLVSPNYSGNICLTGGEPTLLGPDVIQLLRHCREVLPKSSINILTNAKRFSDFEFTKSLALLRLDRFLVCASLHADTDDLHDHIVGAKGSFLKTQQGLYNLAKFSIPIEIRVVVTKLNYDRLPQISEFIARNYPFAVHVAFMGMEVTGIAKDNIDTIWIDMYEYHDIIERAAHELHRRGFCVSIYNHPLCLLPKRAWAFARQSISSWKNAYLQVCNECTVKSECCGIFTTSENRLSEHITPLRNNVIAH